MKREFIKNLLPDISDEILQQIMDEHSKDIGGLKSQTETLTTERDGLKTQLTDAQSTIKSYQDMDIEGIRKSAADWEAKYNSDTKALQQQLDALSYARVADRVAAGLSFSSASAKKAFTADLIAKGLKCEGDKLIGSDDFIKTYRETDPDAFAPEGGGDTQPRIVSHTRGGGLAADAAMRSAFGLSPQK